MAPTRFSTLVLLALGLTAAAAPLASSDHDLSASAVDATTFSTHGAVDSAAGMPPGLSSGSAVGPGANVDTSGSVFDVPPAKREYGYPYNKLAYGCDGEDGYGLNWEAESDEHCRYIPHRPSEEPAEAAVETRTVLTQAASALKRYYEEEVTLHDDGYGYEYRPDNDGVYRRFSLA